MSLPEWLRTRPDWGKFVVAMHEQESKAASTSSTLLHAAAFKEGHRRTTADLQSIALYLKTKAFAEGLEPRDLDRLAFSVTGVSFSAGTAVCKQGDVGDAFYVVLKGHLLVVVNGLGKVAELGCGDSFGELALTSTGVRQATVMVREDTIEPALLLCLSKEHYDNVLRDTALLNLAATSNFLAGVPIFAGLSRNRLRRLAMVMTAKTVHQGDTVARQSDAVDKIIIVRSGRLQVVHSATVETRLRWPTAEAAISPSSAILGGTMTTTSIPHRSHSRGRSASPVKRPGQQQPQQNGQLLTIDSNTRSDSAKRFHAASPTRIGSASRSIRDLCSSTSARLPSSSRSHRARSMRRNSLGMSPLTDVQTAAVRESTSASRRRTLSSADLAASLAPPPPLGAYFRHASIASEQEFDDAATCARLSMRTRVTKTVVDESIGTLSSAAAYGLSLISQEEPHPFTLVACVSSNLLLLNKKYLLDNSMVTHSDTSGDRRHHSQARTLTWGSDVGETLRATLESNGIIIEPEALKYMRNLQARVTAEQKARALLTGSICGLGATLGRDWASGGVVGEVTNEEEAGNRSFAAKLLTERWSCIEALSPRDTSACARVLRSMLSAIADSGTASSSLLRA